MKFTTYGVRYGYEVQTQSCVYYSWVSAARSVRAHEELSGVLFEQDPSVFADMLRDSFERAGFDPCILRNLAGEDFDRFYTVLVDLRKEALQTKMKKALRKSVTGRRRR